MKRIVFIHLLLLILLNNVYSNQLRVNCYPKNKEKMNIENNFRSKYDPKTGLEVYDFEISKKAKSKTSTLVKKSDGTIVLIGKMLEYGAVYDEYANTGL